MNNSSQRAFTLHFSFSFPAPMTKPREQKKFESFGSFVSFISLVTLSFHFIIIQTNHQKNSLLPFPIFLHDNILLRMDVKVRREKSPNPHQPLMPNIEYLHRKRKRKIWIIQENENITSRGDTHKSHRIRRTRRFQMKNQSRHKQIYAKIRQASYQRMQEHVKQNEVYNGRRPIVQAFPKKKTHNN